ncbi:MAG: hypothetical protein LBL74_07515 [Bacteroidales bacterium]|jgi:hypothetical protein|nr:hypothetical protein [Bacteroidales bacterium]
MKKLMLFMSLLCIGFISCEDYADVFPEGKWEYVTESTIITLDNYPDEKRFHTTASPATNNWTLFENDVWFNYKIDEDTLYLLGEYGSIPFLIEHSSADIIKLKYLGMRQFDMTIYDYTFKKVE